MRQIPFQKQNWRHRFSHGGILRNRRAGRGERPLSSKEPIHLVLKVNQEIVPGGLRTPKRFKLAVKILEKYSARFFIKIEQVTIQFDHIHFIVRLSRRSDFQNFLRVSAGQVAQRFAREKLVVTDTPKKLWKHRPFTRVVRGYRALLLVKDYLRLNELEALGKIPYRKSRLRGFSTSDWSILWS